MDVNDARLIEAAFPLRQTSIDSVHEKNVRHGHISTLHIWPARRPLAACRAALIATLLPDPGTPEERRQLIEKLGGRTVMVSKRKKMPNGKMEEKEVEETVGGILHWGRESSADLEWFRQKIREAYGGRSPKVLDPFAGGGAIPLEAMRLGCEATAIDLNPVAWFILKCTLEYPQKLAGQYRPLPQFALESPEFMASYFKGTGKLTKKQLERNLETVQLGLFPPPDVDLSWHVRAWGWWVLQHARQDLAKFYPTYAERVLQGEEGLRLDRVLCPLKEDGTIDYKALNSISVPESDSLVSGWMVKPTVAYLWARTVQCKNCRATIPLLKTRWLCKKDNKRVLLKMEPNAEKTGVVFSVESNEPKVGKNTAQRREHDKKIGIGTIFQSGVICPCCDIPSMTKEDIRLEGLAGRLGTIMTAVVVDGLQGKEYRSPTQEEISLAVEAEEELLQFYDEIPFGLPDEPVPQGGSRASGGSSFTVFLYGLKRWRDLFTPRQLLALGAFVNQTRAVCHAMEKEGYTAEWIEAIVAYLALATSRLSDRASTICHWSLGFEKIQNTFSRFALSISWDFSEGNPIASSSGTYDGQVEWIAKVHEHCAAAGRNVDSSKVRQASAITISEKEYWDVIMADPPYYDAISYADLMDFFYVWLRRILYGLTPELKAVFQEPLTPKWNSENNDGELIDEPARFGGDKTKSKNIYEDGMFRAFQSCHKALKPDGRLVIVFANKNPDAWETLVSAVIRAGFVVDGSWPIQTEMSNRTRAQAAAALSSSVWLVCKKRPLAARPGWDNKVLEEMHTQIQTQLHEFWDSGIRGPDFVWAATGPALEAYSKYPVVKKANEPGQVMKVSEFLDHVRRMVVNFVVGFMLKSKDTDDETKLAEAASYLDDVTAYYLLHRHTFGMEETPIGACILYALSCGLKDRELVDLDLVTRSGSTAAIEPDDDLEEDENTPEVSKGSTVKLKPWNQRTRKSLGYEAPSSNPVPLIDQAHRLMHLWKSGDKTKVDDYLKVRGLHHNALFHQLIQSLIELSPIGSEERSTLESISNDLSPRATPTLREQLSLYDSTPDSFGES
jgi:putative DNA methylase